MRDLVILEALRKGEWQRADLPALLGELAGLPLMQRAPHLGALEAAVVCPSPAVRVAALRALAGANGRITFRLLLSALDDADPDVRRAAVEVFSECARTQSARFVHMLFHPRADVRRMALEVLPSNARPRSLHLLVDPDNAMQIKSWLAGEHRPQLPRHALPLLLGLRRAGELSDRDAALLLSDVEAPDLLRFFEIGRRRARERIDSLLDTLSAGGEAPGGDVLDEICSIVLAAPEPVRGPLLGRFREQLARANVTLRVRAAAALVVAESPLSADALALIAGLNPAVLASPALPRPARREAALSLLELHAKPTTLAKDELAQLITLLADDEQGNLDLRLVAALLRLAAPGQAHQVLSETVSEARLVAAFIGDPVRSAPLLSSRCLPDNERRTLLQRLGSEPELRVSELLALSVWVLPADQIAGFDELTADLALSHARALLALEQRPGVSLNERKLRLITNALGESLVAHAGAFAESWLGAPHPEKSELGPRLFGRAVAKFSAEAFVEVCKSLDPELLERLLPLLPHCLEISFGKEFALAHALADHEREALRAWAGERLQKSRTGAEAPKPVAGRIVRLTPEQTQALVAASSAELDRALARFRGVLSVGLCDALASRAPPVEPSVAACVALLGSHDDEAKMIRLLEAYGSDAPDFLKALEPEAVAAWAHARDLPLPGAAWLWRWDAQSLRFAELALERPAGLPGVLESALGLTWAPLRERVWSAAASAIALWAARDKNRFWEVCVDGRALAQAAVAQLDTELGEIAASLLITLKGMSVPALPPLLPLIRAKLPDVSRPVAAKLDRLLDTRGLTFRAHGVRHHARSAGEAEIGEVRLSSDLDRLERACHSPSEPLVNEAVLRLLGLPGGCLRLAQLIALLPSVPHVGVIADSLTLWPDADALSGPRGLLAAESTAPELRFRLAIAFVERGEVTSLGAAYAAARAPCDESWFHQKDYERLCQLDRPSLVALELAASPHPHAYQRAVESLLEGKFDLPHGPVNRALREFLACGTERFVELRLRAARDLLKHGDHFGAPLIIAKALEDNKADLVRGIRDEDLFRLTTTGVLMAGQALRRERLMVDLLAPVPIETRDHALEQLLLESYDEEAAKKAVLQLDTRKSRHGKLEQVAALFAWGFRTGLMLTGRHHRPHMTSDGAYGYVRRNDPRVYVTPLPLLRGDPNGQEIVEGLILHELGHHRWHAGPDNDRVWATAQRQRLHGLLNLVADEHLERNLRALKPDWGDKLKRLAAYAFQHADKEIETEQLLDLLGVSAFAVLTACTLEVAHLPSRVKVDSGAIMQALEARGHAFARFVRALRMGLGNRHEDPLVDEALQLFPPSFRKLGMSELFEITKRLHELFGDQTRLVESFGGAETVDEGEREKTKAVGELSDEQIQPEVERILDPRKLRGKTARSERWAGGKLGINVSGLPHFNPITEVERLVIDPAAQRECAREVARPAKKLRRFFEELGIKRQPVTRRTTGTRLDRARLQALVLYSDPRVLTARQPNFDTDLFVGVAVDCSGSMSAADNIIKARRFAVLVAEAAKQLDGIDVRIFGFTDTTIFDAGDADHCAAAMFEAGGGNNDAAGLLHLAGVAKDSNRRAKLLVMISDGLPTECSTQALKGLVERLEKRERMVIAQVAVRPLEEQCFRHHVLLDQEDINVVVQRFGQTVARLVKKALH